MKPISLIITVLIFLFSVAASEGEEGKRTCPSCEKINVPYPLSTSQNCGDPNYPLLCDNKTGLNFLSLNETFYPVINIDEKNKTLIITTPTITHECKTEDLKFNGLVIPEKSHFRISDRNTVMLFNCSDSILKSPLNCSSSSPCLRFAEEKAKGCKQGICCSFLKDSKMTNHRIRITEDGCTAYASVVDMDEGQKVDSWNFGVQFHWD